MYVVIKIVYDCEGKTWRNGTFEVLRSEWIKNEKNEATRVAYNFWRYIVQDHGSTKVTLKECIYDDTNDITKELKDLIRKNNKPLS